MPHAAHIHPRTFSGFGPSFTPQAEHIWDVGSNRPVRTNTRPYLADLYSSIAVTDEGADGNLLDQRISTSPTFGRVTDTVGTGT